MKKTLIFFLLCICTILASCSSKKYSDNILCSDVGRVITVFLEDGQEYAEFDDNHKLFYFENSDGYDDNYLAYSLNTQDINEVGVFHAKDETSAIELETTCREYIDGIKQDSSAFIASYAPKELPKLEGAEVRRFGNYVVFAIVPTDKTSGLFEEVEKMLKN